MYFYCSNFKLKRANNSIPGQSPSSANKKPSVLPGFGPALGFTLVYLRLIVLIPLGGLLAKATELGFAVLFAVATAPRVLAALRPPSASRSRRADRHGLRPDRCLGPGPLSLPRPPAGRCGGRPALRLADGGRGHRAGLALSPNGWLGAPLAAIGIKSPSRRWGILVALIFVGLPFVVRTVQPVIAELDQELEEAAATLGAPAGRSSGVSSCPALPRAADRVRAGLRARRRRIRLGDLHRRQPAEVSEIAPLLIVIKLEQYDYAGATAIAAIMLVISFVDLLAINLLQAGADGSAMLRCVPTVLPSALFHERTGARWLLIAVALGFLTLFLVCRLCSSSPGPSQGDGVYLAALADPDALAAIMLTFGVAAIVVPLNLVSASWRPGHRQVRFSPARTC